MKPLRWSPEKNEILKVKRGISFERIAVALETDDLLDIFMHPNQARYPKQRIMVVKCDAYAYLVPFIEEEEYFFLKTIVPSRRATRDYLKPGENNG
jgi:hypothetical protein